MGMLWTPQNSYQEEPFQTEAELENAIKEVAPVLFGSDRFYLDVKKLIGAKNRVRNVPDAYLVDLSSRKRPVLWVVRPGPLLGSPRPSTGFGHELAPTHSSTSSESPCQHPLPTSGPMCSLP